MQDGLKPDFDKYMFLYLEFLLIHLWNNNMATFWKHAKNIPVFPPRITIQDVFSLVPVTVASLIPDAWMNRLAVALGKSKKNPR